MIVNKHLMRRYLLATLVGVVVGLVGMVVMCDHYCRKHVGIGLLQFDCKAAYAAEHFYKVGGRDVARELIDLAVFLLTLLSDKDKSTANFFIAPLLIPFAVYTFDVVAASRRKRGPGAV
jgi:hypothetical protein